MVKHLLKANCILAYRRTMMKYNLGRISTQHLILPMEVSLLAYPTKIIFHHICSRL